jgi:hypothetical protein
MISFCCAIQRNTQATNMVRRRTRAPWQTAALLLLILIMLLIPSDHEQEQDHEQDNFFSRFNALTLYLAAKAQLEVLRQVRFELA